MNGKKTILALFCLLFCSVGSAQIKWNTIEQASEAKIGTKLYFIDFYTSWCGYCKKMDKETFTNPTVAKIMNKYYYPVKFDAESSKTFTWFGKSYGPGQGRRNNTHEFARGVRGYPTFGIYRADGTPVQAIPGFIPAKDFIIIHWYFASGDCDKYPFDSYQRIFDKEIRPIMEKQLQ